MNPAPSPHNDLSGVQEAAQNALHEWNDQSITIDKNPRSSRLLKAIATAGVGALLISGCSVPETHTQPKPTETPFSTQGIEYVRVCQKVEDGTRVEDTSCEATEAASPSASPTASPSASESATATASPSESTSASPSPSPTDSPSNNNGANNITINNGGNGGGGDTHSGHSGTNMFIWYYIGYMMG